MFKLKLNNEKLKNGENYNKRMVKMKQNNEKKRKGENNNTRMVKRKQNRENRLKNVIKKEGKKEEVQAAAKFPPQADH
jgi:hypothetical protein